MNFCLCGRYGTGGIIYPSLKKMGQVLYLIYYMSHDSKPGQMLLHNSHLLQKETQPCYLSIVEDYLY